MRQVTAIFTIALFLSLLSNAQEKKSERIQFTPVSHASFVIQSASATIVVDPVGDAKAYAAFGIPDLILVTDIHGDHLSGVVIGELKKEKTKIVGPPAAVEKLGYGSPMKNGETGRFGDAAVEALPAYNLSADRLKFHEKGRGNGYVVTIEEKRIYISGDTEDIPEMRGLRNIDYAFVCMNLPYTMTVEQAASAVLEFKPKVVFPYHYRGTGGFSDIEKFKKLVSAGKGTDVRFLKWYE